MATKYWLGTAPSVVQKATVQITAYDTATTYKITIGNTTVSVVGSGGTTTTTATSLTAALNASTHPYFSGITWSNSSSDTITGTADVAGVPFSFTASVSGGTGTIGSYTLTQTPTSPNDWSVAANWSDGAVPVDTDTVYIRDCSGNICWGLDQSSVDLTLLVIDKSFTGKIGLDYQKFATTADGATTVSTATEYRENYLKISATTVRIGEVTGAGSPSGSTRILLSNTKSGASQTTVYATASSSADSGRPALRLLAAHASADVEIVSAQGGVGIAAEEPGETATVGDVVVTGSNVVLTIGEGTTCTNIYIGGGTAYIAAAATVAELASAGGTSYVRGDYTITALKVSGGTVYDSHIKSAGNAVTTATMTGGTLDLLQSRVARTYNSLVISGGTVNADSAVMTFTGISISGSVSLSA